MPQSIKSEKAPEGGEAFTDHDQSFVDLDHRFDDQHLYQSSS